MLAIEIVQRLAPDRIDRDHADGLVGHLLLELAKIFIGLVGFGVPAHLQVFHRIVGEQHQQLGFFENDLPRGALRIHLGGPQHIRQDHLPGAGRVVAGGADAATMHAHRAQHVVAAAMHLANRAPAHVGGVQRPRAVILLDAFQLFVNQVEGLVPAHAHEAVVAALQAVAVLAILVPVEAHHRIAHPRRAVDDAERALEDIGRMAVELERHDLDHLVGFHTGTEGPPVRTGELPARPVLAVERSRLQRLHHIGRQQQRGRHGGAGNSRQPFQETATGKVCHDCIPHGLAV